VILPGIPPKGRRSTGLFCHPPWSAASMDSRVFDEVERSLTAEGPDRAIDKLCKLLRERKDFHRLFYALLLRKRRELGLPAVPSESPDELPESARDPYEAGIRAAAREVGTLYLNEGNILDAYRYLRTIDETQPIVQALEKYQPEDNEESQRVVELAFHH